MAASSPNSSAPDALAKLAEIPPVGSEERKAWLELAVGSGAETWAQRPLSRQDIEHAILALMSEARKQGQRDAMTTGIQAGLDAAIRGIDATILNMGGECSVPCEGEEDRGCACSEAIELGTRLIKNLRSADIANIAALATGGANG